MIISRRLAFGCETTGFRFTHVRGAQLAGGAAVSALGSLSCCTACSSERANGPRSAQRVAEVLKAVPKSVTTCKIRRPKIIQRQLNEDFALTRLHFSETSPDTRFITDNDWLGVTSLLDQEVTDIAPFCAQAAAGAAGASGEPAQGAAAVPAAPVAAVAPAAAAAPADAEVDSGLGSPQPRSSSTGSGRRAEVPDQELAQSEEDAQQDVDADKEDLGEEEVDAEGDVEVKVENPVNEEPVDLQGAASGVPEEEGAAHIPEEEAVAPEHEPLRHQCIC